jgi:hypothetical protein
MSAEGRRSVLAAMRSGEWLRTQWIARVAFDLGTAPWRPEYGRRALALLKRLETDGHVEQRIVQAVRQGDIADVSLSFPIPRTEWRLTTTGGE